MSTLRERLVQECGRVATIAPDEAAAALFELGALQASLTARLGGQAVASGTTLHLDPQRLLSPAEAAQRLGVTLRWLYRNAKRLPFTRKLTGRTLRFHEAGLEKYIREKRP